MRTTHTNEFFSELSPEDKFTFKKLSRDLYMHILDNIYDTGQYNSRILIDFLANYKAPELLKLKHALDIEKFILQIGSCYKQRCPKEVVIKEIIGALMTEYQ